MPTKVFSNQPSFLMSSDAMKALCLTHLCGHFDYSQAPNIDCPQLMAECDSVGSRCFLSGLFWDVFSY